MNLPPRLSLPPPPQASLLHSHIIITNSSIIIIFITTPLIISRKKMKKKRKSIFSRLELISEFYVISSHKVQIPAPPPSQSTRPLPTLILLLLHDSRLLLRRWRSRIFLLPRNEKSHAHNSKDFSPILKKRKKRSGFVALFDHIFEI